MRKWKQLSSLVASVAALASLSVALTGCGSGADDNTIFEGTYSGDFIVNRQVQIIDPVDDIAVTLEPNFSGVLSVTINVKGKIIGNLVTVGGTNYSVSGDADEDGRVEGTLQTTSGDSYSFSGIITEQDVSTLGSTAIADLAISDRQNQTPGDDDAQFFAGLAASFNITINGIKQTGTLAITGGQDGTTQ